MTTLILKFGGAAVASPGHFAKIAEIIQQRSETYSQIVVVVSAMGNTTNQLIELANEVHPLPPRRELDMLISVGERVSIALLAMALDLRAKEAISFTGSQSGIITNERHAEASIVDVRPWRLLPHLEAGKVVIVAGFQGVSRKGEITTLGRGGSDTTAVALAVALRAEKVEFYKDVPGICTEDPKQSVGAKVIPFLDYTSALKIAQDGAKILHPRCIALAEKNGVPLQVMSFLEREGTGTWIGPCSRVYLESCLYEEHEWEERLGVSSHV